LCRGTDEGPVEGKALDTATHEQPIGLSALVQQSAKPLKPPKLNIGSCQPAIALGTTFFPLFACTFVASSIILTLQPCLYLLSQNSERNRVLPLQPYFGRRAKLHYRTFTSWISSAIFLSSEKGG
jgi:hypothetical protein